MALKETVFLKNISYPDFDDMSWKKTSVLIKNGLIEGVYEPGQEPDLAKSSLTSAATKDLQGKILIPAFLDSHLHPHNWATREMMPPIREAGSIEEFLNIIDDHMKKLPPDTLFVYISAWKESQFVEKRAPKREELDLVSYGIPLLCSRICGHVAMVNTPLLNLLDWQSQYAEDPARVELDAAGLPTGRITEDFYNYVLDHYSQEETKAQVKAKLAFALDAMGKAGLAVLGANDQVFPFNETFWGALEELYQERPDLPAYYAQVSLSSPNQIEALAKLKERYQEHPKIQICHIKLFKDGSLGGRTALLREDYEDTAGRGADLISKEKLEEWFKEADKWNIPLAIHAIGDKASEDIADAALKTKPDGPRPRHLLIHAQIHDRDLLDRLKQSGLYLCVQPSFTISDWTMARAALGDRLDQSYLFHAMCEKGIPLGFSTDSPVEKVEPLYSIGLSMKDPRGPAFSFDFLQALEAYSKGNARIWGLEDRLGQMKPAYQAKLLILDETDPRVLEDPDLLMDVKILERMD